MGKLQRRSDDWLLWRRWVTLPLVLVAVALASIVAAAPATAQETPLESIDLSLERTCTPDTFRPNEYVAVECVTRLANHGQSTLTDIGLEISTTTSGPIPSHLFIWSSRNGELLPIGTGALSFEAADLAPGETNVSSTVVLLKMDEGTFESELRASVGGQVVASVPIRFVATPEAAEPPTDLLVTKELVGEAGVEAQPTATYEITITNQGSTEVTELTLTDRYSEWVALVSAEPAPASQNPAVQLASWDLASFGKDALAPGESLVLRTTYGPSESGDCGYVESTGVLVEASIGGQEQRYGTRAAEAVQVGECPGPLPYVEIPPTPTPLPPGWLDLSFERPCTPDTFRPNEYVAIECVVRVANHGPDTLNDVSLGFGGYSGPVPSYFFMWSRRDGEFLPISTSALSFGGGDLEPGQTVVSSAVVLLKIDEGTFETELRALAGRQVAASVPIFFVATPEAAEPPSDLLVSMELVSDTGPEAEFAATYETTITNQGSSEVTELTMTDRYNEGATLVSANPAPASQNPEVQLASWDLASFGKDSLSPGESLALRVTYGPSEEWDCWSMSTGAVVEATVGGQEQRYGARPARDAFVGECGGGGRGGGGGELPMALGQGGEGPGPTGGDGRWVAIGLTIAGVLLIGAGLAARRQARL